MNRVSTINVKTRKTALRRMPWANWIVKVEGGYRGFEDYADYLAFLDYKPQQKHLAMHSIYI